MCIPSSPLHLSSSSATVALMSTTYPFHLSIYTTHETSGFSHQYSWRNCLVLHGVPDDVNAERAVLDICNNKLGIAIGHVYIDRTVRLSAPDSSDHKDGARPQPIIVKCTSYRARQDVFMAKRRLKGTKVMFMENLTKRRIYLLNRAKSLCSFIAAWTSNGRIICFLAKGGQNPSTLSKISETSSLTNNPTERTDSLLL